MRWRTHGDPLIVHNRGRKPFLHHLTASSYQSMVQRCTNPRGRAFANYGGRGITICERWLGKNGYTNFIADLGPRPDGTTLDRIDPHGNYEPSNCRWATLEVQNRNKRRAPLTVEQREHRHREAQARYSAKKKAA